MKQIHIHKINSKTQEVDYQSQILGAEISSKNKCIISPQFIKICCTGEIVTWSITLVLGVLVAQLDPAGPKFDLAGYNPLIDYLSNMGSIYYTPFPFIFNFGISLLSILMIPVLFYLKNLMIKGTTNKLRKLLATAFVILMVIGVSFLGFAGLINSELSGIWEEQLFFPLNACNWHLTIAAVSFTCLVLGNGIFSLHVLIYSDFFRNTIQLKYPDLLKFVYAVNSIVLVPIFLGFFMASPHLHSLDLFWITLPFWKWKPMWEWLFAFSMLFSLFFVCISLLKHLNYELYPK